MSETMVESKTIETPFTSGALRSKNSVQFWKSYLESRPSPTEDFFHLINEYHKSHGDVRTDIAHDVGTGPGNIAARLAAYFNRVVGSDINGDALATAPSLLPSEVLGRMTFINSRAEELAQKTPAEVGGKGTTDLITVSECMPLLDPDQALKAFSDLLRPGGTLGIYFYGPAVFTDGDIEKCNAAYDKVATRICSFNQPMKGTPGFPFQLRGVEALISYMDNIAIPSQDWESVERHKWNCDYPLLFNSKEGFDFEFYPTDRRAEGEVTKEVIDRNFWGAEWSIDNVKGYLDSVYPNYRDKAGDRQSEVDAMLEELHEAMGNEKRNITFPVVLILATKKASPSTASEETTLPKAHKVQLNPERPGIARLTDNPPESLEKACELLQKNHDEFHVLFRDLNSHNHMAHSILTTFALGGSPEELQRAYDDGVEIQRGVPPLDLEIVKSFYDDNRLYEALGQITQYTNVMTFYEQQIDKLGLRAVVQKYCFGRTKLANAIFARMFEGAYHPVIHLGLAIEFEQPSILAEALAQATIHPSSGVPECILRTDEEALKAGSEAPRKLLLDIFGEARAQDLISRGARWEDRAFKMRDGVLGRAKEFITSLAAQFRVDPSELEQRAAEVISCNAFVAGATQRPNKAHKIDFFHMHGVTSSIFLTVMLQEPWIALEDKVRLVKWKGRADLLYYASSGCGEIHPEEITGYQAGVSDGWSWNELYRNINKMHDDGHVGKFVRALKSGQEVCRPFQQKGLGGFTMSEDAWLSLAHMSYDTTFGLPDPAKWIFATGFDEAWAPLPARPVKPKYPSFTKQFHTTAYEALNTSLPALSAAGKNIVVTGGGTGIGAATALRFAQAGASSVSIIGKRASPLESSKSNIESLVPGAKIITHAIDITQKDSINATFKAIHDSVGEIHVLVNNAGYVSTPAPIKDADEQEWWHSFETNVRGTFLTTQAFLHHKAADAVVLYVTSGLSHVAMGVGNSSYSASKAAAVRMFATLQTEQPELRVICLHPGMIETDAHTKSGHEEKGDDASLPAGTMVWLASPEAEFLKGKYIWANWDIEEMKAREAEIKGSDLLTMKLGGWPFAEKSS